GKEVFFSTGTDEHGQKIWEASVKEGKNAQDYVDQYAQKFLDLKTILNISNDNFIRTTSVGHILAAQEFWRLCDAKGDIYKKKYKGLYCVGCEKFLTEKDIVDGLCPIHPTKTPEVVEEENFFFKLTKYRKELLDYLSNEKAIIPEWRRKEAIDFVENGMEDFSVSRSKERFSWGVSIPGDDTQVMYVWFDAFINYISTLGWHGTPPSPLQGEGRGEVKVGGEESKFQKFWVNGEHIQTAGKDMVKFQSVMWQGMLMSAGLPTTDTVVYHGFITGEGGIKMSKSIGNVINPNDIVKEYGTDALRYFLLREISSFEDSPFTMERFKDAYNANLANGLGNLVSRIMKMAETYIQKLDKKFLDNLWNEYGNRKDYEAYILLFNFTKACDVIWNKIANTDAYIQGSQPFKVIKEKKENGEKIIKILVGDLYLISKMLEPILPETALKIKECILQNKMPEKPLFLRKE
ncbi:methionine--tRNA ligase, partial [Candidatus Nomurabacteria bacterium RIFCSPLOWO2_02_FULL_40_10]